ncbi:MAG: hypothetical protein KatS3mg015_3127 [Fimbriimonadales bacterium]|nr:MAG: hypothetical protein KatS3mg015_3127 [Fimbriimonadales bacterium]
MKRGSRPAGGLSIPSVGFFDILPEDICRLDPTEFHAFMNHLITAESERLGLQPGAVNVTAAISQAGPDARVQVPRCDGRWIPAGDSVWEFTTEYLGPKDAGQEVRNRLADIRAGATLVLACARDWGGAPRARREEAIRETLRRHRLPPSRARLLTAGDLARWASEHPVMRLVLGRPLGSCYGFDQWESEHPGAFVADAERTDIIADIGRLLATSGSPVHFRIEGLRGVGKSRLALEAVRAARRTSQVLYAPEPQALPREFWTWVRTRTTVSGVVVVDECDRSEAERLKQQASLCEGRIRLLTVGVGEQFLAGSVAPSERYLDPLPDPELRQVILGRFPGLPHEQVDWVVRCARGYVRLALLVAEALELDPSLDVKRLPQMPVLRDFLQALVPKEEERQALRAIALLSRVGIDGNVAGEGKVVAEFVGLEWPEFRQRLEDLRRRRLVQKRGPYRYVTPDLVGAWLAAEVWTARTDDMLELLNRLPTTAQEAFLERLRDIGTLPEIRPAVRRLLDAGGLFPDVSALSDAGRARMFRWLAFGDPEGAVEAVERLLADRSLGELRQFCQGRRPVIEALQYAKWFKACFKRAAKLLLSLAEAENEDLTNNATGVWTEIFHPWVGGTEVPALERLELIDEILADPSPARRRLGVIGLGAVFRLQGLRIGTWESTGARAVPKEWRPATRNELLAVHRRALLLLDRAVDDLDPEVASQGRAVLLGSVRALVRVGLAEEAIERLERLAVKSDIDRRAVRQTVESVLRFHAQTLLPEERERLVGLRERLIGKSFRERLRRWVGPWTLEDRLIDTREGGLPAAERAAQLAEEVVGAPDLLQPELEWLASSEAENVGYFARRLGELDRDREWFEQLVPLAGDKHGRVLVACYLWGRALASDGVWVDSVLDRWAEHEPDLAPVLLETTWRRGLRSGDIPRLVKLVKAGLLEPGKLQVLRYAEGFTSLTSAEIKLVLEVLVGDAGERATEAGLDLLVKRLGDHPEDKEDLSALSWWFLERLPGQRSYGEYLWGELADHYVSMDPARLARVVVGAVSVGSGVYSESDPPLAVLKRATEQNPPAVWECVGEKLLAGDLFASRLRVALRYWYPGLVPTALLLEWAETHGPDGPRVVASLTQPHGVSLDELSRELLRRFGDDSRVAEFLWTNLVAGVYYGSTSEWLNSKLETVQRWAGDPDARVRRWVDEAIRRLRKWLERQRELE